MWSFTPAQCAEPRPSTCCLGGNAASETAHRQRCVRHSGTLRPFQKLQVFRAERRQGTPQAVTQPLESSLVYHKSCRGPQGLGEEQNAARGGGEAGQYRKTAPGLQGETAGFSPPHHRHQHSPRNPTQEGDDPARGGNQPLPAFHPGKQSTCLPWQLAAEPVPPTQQREPCLAQSLLYPVQVLPHHHPRAGDSLTGDSFFPPHLPLLTPSTWLVPRLCSQPHLPAKQPRDPPSVGVTAAAEPGQIFGGTPEPTSSSAASDTSFNLSYNNFFFGLMLLEWKLLHCKLC